MTNGQLIDILDDVYNFLPDYKSAGKSAIAEVISRLRLESDLITQVDTKLDELKTITDAYQKLVTSHQPTALTAEWITYNKHSNLTCSNCKCEIFTPSLIWDPDTFPKECPKCKATMTGIKNVNVIR